MSERIGFEPALLNVGAQVLRTDVRKSGRCIVDDPRAAAELWRRLQHAVPQELQVVKGGDTWEAVGLNERLRILKYTPGDYFAPHKDGSYVRGLQGESCEVGKRDDQSFFTLMIYLNGGDSMKGGETKFLNPYDQSQDVAVIPHIG